MGSVLAGEYQQKGWNRSVLETSPHYLSMLAERGAAELLHYLLGVDNHISKTSSHIHEFASILKKHPFVNADQAVNSQSFYLPLMSAFEEIGKKVTLQSFGRELQDLQSRLEDVPHRSHDLSTLSVYLSSVAQIYDQQKEVCRPMTFIFS